MNQREKQKEATRKHLFDVGMRLFERRGYQAVNIDDIVRGSRVARGTFYFHFPTKEDLLLEAIKQGERQIVARLGELSPGASLDDVLATTCLAFEEVWGGRRELLGHACVVALRRIAAVASERDDDHLRAGLLMHFERALAAGALRSALPPRMLADIFLMNVFAAMMAWAQTGAPALGAIMPAVIGLFLRGASGFEASAPRPRRRTSQRS